MNEVMEDKGKISDGYHTFDELYEHRHHLFMLVIEMTNLLQATTLDKKRLVKAFKAEKHYDGKHYDGWFLCCLIYRNAFDQWHQISYHLPISLWDKVNADPYEYAPLEWDGHSSQDCIRRLDELRELLKQNTLIVKT